MRGLHRRSRGLVAGISGDVQYFDRGVHREDLSRQLVALESGHHQICHQQMDRPRIPICQNGCLHTISSFQNREAALPQDVAEQSSQGLLILHYQNRLSSRTTLLLFLSTAAGALVRGR